MDASGDEAVQNPLEYYHPCCVKEREAEHRRTLVMGKLEKHDRAAKALERQKAAKDFHSSQRVSLGIDDYADLVALRDVVKRPAAAEDGPVDEEGSDEVTDVGEDEHDDVEGDEADSDEELDEFLAEMEELGIEDERQTALRAAQKAAEELSQLGVGRHVALPHGESVLDAVGTCDAVVVHLTPSCGGAASACIDLCLEEIAPNYLGTRFVRLPLCNRAADTLLLTAGACCVCDDGGSAENGGVLLAFRRSNACGVEQRPSHLLGNDLIHNIVDMMRTSTELLQRATGILVSWLVTSGVLVTVAPSRLPELLEKAKSGGLGPTLRETNGRRQLESEREVLEDAVEEDFFDCGLAGCHKSFSHCHVGLDIPKEFVA